MLMDVDRFAAICDLCYLIFFDFRLYGMYENVFRSA